MLNPLLYKYRERLPPGINFYEGVCTAAQTMVGGYVASKLFSRLSDGHGLAMAAVSMPINLLAIRSILNLDKAEAQQAQNELQQANSRKRHLGLPITQWFAPEQKTYLQATGLLSGTMLCAPLLARLAGYPISFGSLWRYHVGASILYPIASLLILSQCIDRVLGNRSVWLRFYGITEWLTRPAALASIKGIELNQDKLKEPPPEITLEQLNNVDPWKILELEDEVNTTHIQAALQSLSQRDEEPYADFGKLMRNLVVKLENLSPAEAKGWVKQLDDAFKGCGSQWQQVAERVYLRLTIPGGTVTRIIAEHNHEVKKRILASWSRFNVALNNIHMQHALQKGLLDQIGLRFVGNSDPEALVNQQGGPQLARQLELSTDKAIKPFLAQFFGAFTQEYTAELLVKEHLALWSDANYQYRQQFWKYLQAELQQVAPDLEQAEIFMTNEFLDKDYKLNQAAIIFALKRTGYLIDDNVIVLGKKNETVLSVPSVKDEE